MLYEVITRYKVDSDPNPFIRVDMNKCILCRRCVEACAEIQVRDVWGVAKRGFEEVIVAGAGTTIRITSYNVCYTKLLRSSPYQ